jgi:cell division protein FtsI/penicillin-binding protein 2
MDPYKNRLKILTIIIILITLTLVFGLFQKQILESGKYLALAQKQYTVTQEIVPNRGEIFISDIKDGTPSIVAENMHFYDLLAVPKEITDKVGASQKLADIIGMSQADIYNQINNNKPYIPPIKKKIDADTAKKIEALNISGIMLVPNIWRYYPENNLASQVIGFVDSSGTGRYGVEGYYNSELKGSNNQVNVDRSQVGPYVGDINPDSSKNGSDIYLTIDKNIQFEAEQLLQAGVTKNQADSGSIVIMEPKTGKILASASVPNFNPNNYYDEKSVNVFNNPAISYAYEPGSVFKPIAMSAGLDSGKVTPDTENVFGSSVQIGAYTVKTATGKAYGRENMAKILQNSDNVGMSWVAQLMGNDILYKYIKDFGFGGLTQVDLQGEATGKVQSLKDWHPITLATNSFGQGIAVTPLQLTSAISAIANGGELMQPYVVDKIIDPSGQVTNKNPKKVKQVISADTDKKITDMMISVVESEHGANAKVDGYWVAGKTGTAQIPNPTGKGYLVGANIGSFGGFAPADNPKFAMLVKIDKPKNVAWAEDSAAPIFGQMGQWLMNYYQIPKER